MSDRRPQLEAWLQAVRGAPPVDLRRASSDASSRQYWRLGRGRDTLIAVDAPPPQEDVERFVRLARELRTIGLNAPEVFAQDSERGFLLLGDLGRRAYLDCLDEQSADRLYGDAIRALIRLQTAGPRNGLPDYDAAFLRRELALFDEWLIGALLSQPLTPAQRRVLDDAYALLVENALEQPRVCVHRDYHSRNLMLTDRANPGILDFQDAVIGPVTYDLASLLKDCYIRWPRARLEGWVGVWVDQAIDAGVLLAEHKPRVPRWLDLMGAQRHLKAAGIFARLALRDGKPSYLADLPRTLGYLAELDGYVGEMADLTALIRELILPACERACAVPR